MVKLSVVTGGITISIDVSDLNITIEDLKKIIEEKMPEGKKITSDKQILYVKQKKLDAGNKLSEYISESDEGVRIFVLKVTKSNLNKTENKEPNPYSSEPKASNPYNQSFQQSVPPQQPYPGSGYVPQQPMGYPPMYPPQMGYNPQMGYPPMNSPQIGYPPMNSPQMGYPQMNSPMNFKMSKEMIDMVLNNPALFDQMIEMQTAGLSPEMKESFKQSTMSAFKMLQNDPSLIDRINQMSGGMPQHMPSYGYPPQQNMYNSYLGYPNMNYGSPQPQSPVLTRDQYKAQFVQQMEALKDMGFMNEEENLDALIKSRGDINYALDLLRKDANFPQN
ncbi:hypothetical protein P3W45_001008 [Vairimorpha bombi]